MTSPREFGAPWSRSLKWISGGGVAILLVVLVVIATRPDMPGWKSWLLCSAITTIPAGSLLFTVRGYEIGHEDLLVRRLIWRSAIPLTGLRSVEFVPHACRKAMRLWGNGGLFAFSGWFWNRSLGRFRLFATDLARTVVLRFSDRTCVVTPDRPEDFVKKLKQQAHLA